MKTLDIFVLAGIAAAGFLLIKYMDKQSGAVDDTNSTSIRNNSFPTYGAAVSGYNYDPLREGIMYI